VSIITAEAVTAEMVISPVAEDTKILSPAIIEVTPPFSA